MGRPLNKKYFGSLAASGIGGEGVDSITITAGGSYTSIPGVSIDGPDLPGGVAATLGDVHMGAASATIESPGGSGSASASYIPGDMLTVVGGTGTAATFEIIRTMVRTFGADNAGTTVWTTGDTLTFGPGGGWGIAAVIEIIANAGAYAGFSITNPGSYTGTSALQAVAPTSTSVADGGGYKNDSTWNLGMGVLTVNVDAAGNYTALPANPVTTSTDSAAGEGAELNITYEVIGVDVSTPGSGYVDAADAGVSFDAGAATADAVLTATTEPAITPYAVTIDGGTVLPADIIKQTGDNNYLMETTEGQTLCTLGTTDSPVFGGAYLLATDANGSTYYVTKLTAHLAVLVQKAMVGSYVYQTGDNAPWSLEAADNLVVQVNNT